MKKKNIKPKKPKQPKKKKEPTQKQKQKQTQNIKINLGGLGTSAEPPRAQAPIIHYSSPYIPQYQQNFNPNNNPQTNPPNTDYKDELSKLRNDFQKAYKDASTDFNNVIKSVNEGHQKTNDRLNSLYNDFYKPQSTVKMDNIVKDILESKTPIKQEQKIIDITTPTKPINISQIGFSGAPDIRTFLRSPSRLFMPQQPLFMPNTPIKLNNPLLLTNSPDDEKDIEEEIAQFEAETTPKPNKPNVVIIDDKYKFICPDCGKKTTTQSNLNRHLREAGHGGYQAGQKISKQERSRIAQQNSLKRFIK